MAGVPARQLPVAGSKSQAAVARAVNTLARRVEDLEREQKLLKQRVTELEDA